MVYEPLSYWKKAGEQYYNNFMWTEQFALQENTLSDYLETLKFNTVLELGCGFGRITRLLSNNFRLDKYTAVDISLHQLEKAEEICPDTVEFIQMDINKFWPTKAYDLVIAVEVLMHQLPSEIEKLIHKMILMSRQHIINIDYYEDNPVQLDPHNFLHNYPKLYDFRAKRIEIKNQSIFHMDKTHIG